MKAPSVTILFGLSVLICFTGQIHADKKDGKSTNTTSLRGVSGILELIRQGEEQIVQQTASSENRDFTLVIGNTGVGRTTLTKLLTGPLSSLSSSWAGDGFLIADNNGAGEISSGNSTLVSKSIFTSLKTSENNALFFDLPGFRNTRGPSYEIPLAVLSKKVASIAKRVKILFVVNYSSLQTGESRMDFINFLESAATFLKNPAKYSNSIFLVATKVSLRSPSPDFPLDEQTVIKGIGRFIENVKGHLGTVVRDSNLRSRVSSILEALLVKQEDGSYNHLAIFPEPTGESASLSPEFDQVKQKLTSQLSDNVAYTDSQASDFGLAISPAAKVYARHVQRELEGQILDIIKSIGAQLKARYNIPSHSQNLCAKLYRDLKSLRGLTLTLEEVISMDPQKNPPAFLRTEFFEILNETLGPLESALQIPGVPALLKEIVVVGKSLTFLEETAVVEQSFNRRTLEEWTDALGDAVQSVSNEIYRVTEDLNLQLEAVASSVFGELSNVYQKKVNESKSEEKSDLAGDLSVDIYTLNEMIAKNYEARTVNSFVNETIASLARLSVELPKEEQHFRALAEDVEVTDEIGEEWGTSPLKSYEWLRPAEQLVQLLRHLKARLQVEIQDLKYVEALKSTTE